MGLVKPIIFSEMGPQTHQIFGKSGQKTITLALIKGQKLEGGSEPINQKSLRRPRLQELIIHLQCVLFFFSRHCSLIGREAWPLVNVV